VLTFVFHLVVFAMYMFTLIYERLYVPLPTRKTYAGRFKFLTFWNQVCSQCMVAGLYGLFVPQRVWVKHEARLAEIPPPHKRVYCYVGGIFTGHNTGVTKHRTGHTGLKYRSILYQKDRIEFNRRVQSVNACNARTSTDLT